MGIGKPLTSGATTITVASNNIVESSDNKAGDGVRKDDYSFEIAKIVESSEIPKYGNLDLTKTLVEASEGVSGYLLDVYYDGSRGVAAVRLYDDRDNVMYVWFDATGHKPYFLTDLPPDKIQGIRGIVSHPGFDYLETVEKFDLLRWTKRRVTKIVVKTPDVVRVLRDKVPRAWEANIKYHHNYIYDLQLIPGMKYKVVGKKLEPIEFKVGEEEEKKIIEKFRGENESTIRMAVEWLPIFEQPPPKIKMLAVDIEVFTPFKGRIPSATEASYPVISVGFASNDGLKLVFVLARQGLVWGEKISEAYRPEAVVEVFDSERALILETIRLIANYPLILTFNGDNFDFPYLYNRALKLGIPKHLLPFRFTRTHVSLRYGVHIDLYKFFSIRAVQSYAFGNAYKEFTLDAIAQALLGEKKAEVETTVSDLTVAELVAYNLRDAELTLKLMTFNGELVWKLIVLLMRISKLPLEDVTRSQVSAWIKSLFYWEHRRRGYLIPTREEIVRMKGEVKSAAIIKGKKYQGAIVLDPPSGVFFKVVVLDFASLYPSIIKKWNLSYETINPAYCPESKLVEIPGLGHKVCMAYPGLTAQIVGLLRDYRVKIYKKKAKDKSLSDIERQWYDVVQSAMKVYINASYGVFGAENFPLYAPPLAESVTAIGRFAITESLKKAS
ncbi:MAG TPA: DNA-directed DNA polymerase I, partial [Pyrodictium sp.]|nr:DNA-directed DNA polymerase I [Pyrodictium sp.]